MEDKPLDIREEKEEPLQEVNTHGHASDGADGGDGQDHLSTQPTQDGQLYPPENPPQAAPIVLPSPLDACHPYAFIRCLH
jgi:hypothetical protein